MTCPAPLLNSLWFTILSLILLAYTSRVRVRVRSGGVWRALNCLNCFRSLLEQLKGFFLMHEEMRKRSGTPSSGSSFPTIICALKSCKISYLNRSRKLEIRTSSYRLFYSSKEIRAAVFSYWHFIQSKG
jgi:hypothetical protein